MSKKNQTWSKERYALALNGHEGIPPLRKTVEGFTVKDGYDLRLFKTWSPYQKRRIRDYSKRVHFLMAQPRRVVYPKNKATNKKLQEINHGDLASSKFKAVFLLHDEPLTAEGKRVKSRISYTKHGVTIKDGQNVRHVELFDQESLAEDPETEIDRVLAEIPDSTMYYVQVGMFQTLSGRDEGQIKRQIHNYMNKYDGVSPIVSGRHRGEDPRSHYYAEWMKGIVGLSYDGKSAIEVQREFIKGVETQKLKRKQRDDLERKYLDILRGIKKGKYDELSQLRRLYDTWTKIEDKTMSKEIQEAMLKRIKSLKK